MATFEIINAEAPYYTIEVRFADQVFTQQVVSVKTGKALTTQLQTYADQYQAAWVPVTSEEQV